ncbi:hypothetical protein [Candidatus Palauibacter sp.]|uniref:hypothetical protein n=1 Tax=Candidatus Palauibacter sp. TaxID=3101350 RepID=UPI003AF3107A
MSRGCLGSIMAAALALSCSGDPTGPGGSLCATRHGAEVCVDRPEYGLNQSIVITTRNVSGSTIFKDACATTRVRVPDDEEDFRPFYAPRLRCGVEVTRAEIVQRMVRLAPGASFEETLRIAGSVRQGYYRVHVWILAEDGTLAADTPATSGVFTVFPSASS